MDAVGNDIQEIMGIKYQIHSALVQQQNSSQKVRSGSREIASKRDGINYISDGIRYQSAQTRDVRCISKAAYATKRSPAPNQIFRMLEFKHEAALKPRAAKLSLAFDEQSHSTYAYQLRNYAISLKYQLLGLKQIPRIHHYIVSLHTNAKDVINREEFSDLTDYIQYGLASQNSRTTFSVMFHTRVKSTLFQKWRQAFVEKQYHKALSDIHTVSVGKQSLVGWHRVL